MQATQNSMSDLWQNIICHIEYLQNSEACYFV